MGKIITLRKAEMHDSADLAILDNIASHGLSEWFWQDAVMHGEAKDAYEWGRQRMSDKSSVFGYTNAVMALLSKEIAGAAVGCLGDTKNVATDKASNPVISPVLELFAQCDGEWLLDSLAVYSNHTNQGVGGMLLDDCFRRAKVAGASTLSLVAEDSNLAAISVYQSRGFKTRDKREYVPFKKGIETKYWVLMSAPVN